MNKKVIIFDLDGVLFDSMEASSKRTLDQFPTITPELQKELLCGNFHDEIQKLMLTHKRKEETDEERGVGKVAYEKVKAESVMFAGMHDLVKELHEKGYILALNTSAIERTCFPLLEKTGIKELFDFFGTREVATSKVEKFKTIKEKYQVSDKDMLFITDTLGDIREADEAHMPTVAVTWGAHDEIYFKRESHENLKAIVTSVKALQDFIYTI